MRKLFALLGLLPTFALAQVGGTTGTPTSTTAYTIEVVTAIPSGSCSATPNTLRIILTTGVPYCCQSSTWTACGAAVNPGLPADPTACAANRFVTDQDDDGNLTCTQPAFTDLSGSATDAQIPNTITVNRTEARAISVDTPTAAEDITIFRAPWAMTLTALHCVITSGTSVGYTIRYGSDRSAAGTQAPSGTITCSSLTTGTATTSLSNTAVSAGDWVWLETSALSGTVNNMTVTITYTIP